MIILAGMIAADKDAWICDLAETYGVFDYKALPVQLLATLSVGLRDHSRIKMKLNGLKVPSATMLQMLMVDCLRMLVWMNSADGAKNVNRPKPLLEGILERSQSDIAAFASGEDFERRRKELLEEVR